MTRAERAARREAYERRAWRLATLLTGDTNVAVRVLGGAQRTTRNWADLDPVHLDRLIVLHARKVMGRGRKGAPDLCQDAHARALMDVLLGMKPQAREAWALARVDRLDATHIARAMDASKTASAHYLDAADAHVREHLDDRVEACTEALRACADALDPEPWLVAHHGRMRERKWIIGLMIAAALAGAIAVALTVIV